MHAGNNAEPLTTPELHRLAVIVRQRLELGSILGVDVDTSTLRLVYRLVETERAIRASNIVTTSGAARCERGHRS